MAKHKYNLDVDDIYVYEVEFVGENDRCLRDCAMSGSNGTPEEDSDIDTENDADAEGGDSEDETSSMHDSTSSQDSGKSTLSDAVSFLDPMDGDTGISSTSDCLDWAGFDRQRDCSSPSSEVIWSDTPTIETPPWDSLNLASSSSSDETGSVFSDDTIISSWTTRGEDGSADEDDSRICPRRCLDLEDMEDWSIDGCGNLWPMIF
ncbi:uncharacterized protein A1O5_11080 [Cladophialophora psammophila CBS 110553]|uniref:Uncharacterized protein n=1 Tax=Cladophialophora psammophila CBS 110553 TaxID=1182543 RepID=W9X5Y3_9EURO|nr:uncharacterized protein A1O5_11080 [Cladophialophora psammophila CBS 110553]EXJ65839.1 hypothetical protein A1O5_11080 [Cladophialophora psammophila CBS 110553]